MQDRLVSMPSRAWIVTRGQIWLDYGQKCFNALTGLNCYFPAFFGPANKPLFQCPHGLELLQELLCKATYCIVVSMPSRAWIVTKHPYPVLLQFQVSMPSRAWIVTKGIDTALHKQIGVSMPSRAWIVTLPVSQMPDNWKGFNALTGLNCYVKRSSPFKVAPMFQCPHGLELLPTKGYVCVGNSFVSMPSRAWIVTVFSWESNARNCVSMPSRAWIVTLFLQYAYMYIAFQCPHGLELLRQECPIF